MITIKKAVTEEDVRQLALLADEIWHEHFTPIIGIDQVEYMLKRFQSYEAIKNMIENEGYHYYMAYDGGVFCAYIGVHPEQEERLFISKLYVERAHRGKKISKKLLAYVTEAFPHLKTQWLTVNRYNDNSIAAYEKMGFVKMRTQCSDIGDGFVMDDYVMERVIN